MSEVVASNGTALMNFIERASRDETFDVAKFGELLRLQRDVGHDQSRRAFNAAMAEAQAEMLPVVRDARNSHLGNRYAKLETIDAAMRPIYTKHGFSVRYGSAPAPGEGNIRITCTVAHAAGYFEENYLDAPVAAVGSQGGRTQTTPVQAIGSAITYLRRYLLSMCFNAVLTDDDDDGEGTRRAIAAGVGRPTRKWATEPVATTPDPLDESDGPRWLLNLELALGTAESQEEVVTIGGHQSVGHATAHAPPAVQRRISELLADVYGRFAATEKTEAAAGEPVATGD